jgi:hypothetical protein
MKRDAQGKQVGAIVLMGHELVIVLSGLDSPLVEGQNNLTESDLDRKMA